MAFVIFCWQVHEEVRDFGFARNQGMAALHTGGAVGASSVLLILPRKPQQQTQASSSSALAAAAAAQSSAHNPPLPPHGVVVAILCNMEDVGLRSLAMDIAREFQVRQTNTFPAFDFLLFHFSRTLRRTLPTECRRFTSADTGLTVGNAKKEKPK